MVGDHTTPKGPICASDTHSPISDLQFQLVALPIVGELNLLPHDGVFRVPYASL